jgi:hypothetical protein
MAEIIEKHRMSGHYDDPNYAFERWFVEVLPFIKPGMRDVHMHVPWNPWPLVRDWTEEEFSEIPESLHQYLAPPK